MQQLISHIISGNTFLLSSERCIFWEEQKILIISDLHFGKTGHFRKSGIAVPQAIFTTDLQRLTTQLEQFKPDQVIVIGDMFHSKDNKEHDFFSAWRKGFSQLSMLLVKGNHDILKDDWYAEAGIEICGKDPQSLNAACRIKNFVFVHDITDLDTDKEYRENYFFSGHIHPGISLHGSAKQSMRFPCFHFGKQVAVLPAFSKFTGTQTIKPKIGESVYILIEQNQLQGEAGGILKIR